MPRWNGNLFDDCRLVIIKGLHHCARSLLGCRLDAWQKRAANFFWDFRCRVRTLATARPIWRPWPMELRELSGSSAAGGLHLQLSFFDLAMDDWYAVSQ
mmetsp:Transcript_1343/g.2333  ORF Transcript_1343/g.2333 Transcript_1343/m.2333 type:complete len:99 (-) Transcript_1343:120-416(-)